MEIKNKEVIEVTVNPITEQEAILAGAEIEDDEPIQIQKGE